MAFTLRLSKALHKQAAAFALDRGISLQALVAIALSDYLRVRSVKRVVSKSRVKRGS